MNTSQDSKIPGANRQPIPLSILSRQQFTHGIQGVYRIRTANVPSAVKPSTLYNTKTIMQILRSCTLFSIL